jgi:hypothetical protein
MVAVEPHRSGGEGGLKDGCISRWALCGLGLSSSPACGVSSSLRVHDRCSTRMYRFIRFVRFMRQAGPA